MTTQTRVPWTMLGGEEQGRAALEECARSRAWAEATGIEAIDNRVVWSADEEGATLYYRVEAA